MKIEQTCPECKTKFTDGKNRIKIERWNKTEILYSRDYENGNDIDVYAVLRKVKFECPICKMNSYLKTHYKISRKEIRKKKENSKVNKKPSVSFFSWFEK